MKRMLELYGCNQCLNRDVTGVGLSNILPHTPPFTMYVYIQQSPSNQQKAEIFISVCFPKKKWETISQYTFVNKMYICMGLLSKEYLFDGLSIVWQRFCVPCQTKNFIFSAHLWVCLTTILAVAFVTEISVYE